MIYCFIRLEALEFCLFFSLGLQISSIEMDEIEQISFIFFSQNRDVSCTYVLRFAHFSMKTNVLKGNYLNRLRQNWASFVSAISIILALQWNFVKLQQNGAVRRPHYGNTIQSMTLIENNLANFSLSKFDFHVYNFFFFW